MAGFWAGRPARADHAGRDIATLIFPLTIYSLNWLGWLLLLFGVFGHVTAFQRFAYAWRKME